MARHWPSGAITSPAGLAAGEHLHRHWRSPESAGSAPLSALPLSAPPLPTHRHPGGWRIQLGDCPTQRERPLGFVQRLRARPGGTEGEISVPATQGGHGRRLRRREQPRGLPRARAHRSRGASAPRRWSQLGQDGAGRGGRWAHVAARCLRRGHGPPRAASLTRRRSAPERQRRPTRLPDFP